MTEIANKEEREQQLLAEIRQLEKDLSSMSRGLAQVASYIADPYRLWQVGFDNTDYSRDPLIGKARYNFNFADIQQLLSPETLRDLVAEFQAKLVELHGIQGELQRPRAEMELYKISGR
jgi:hypothetical protein